MISVEIMCNGFFKCLLGKLILQETEASSGKEIKIFVKGGNFVVFLCKILLPFILSTLGIRSGKTTLPILSINPLYTGRLLLLYG